MQTQLSAPPEAASSLAEAPTPDAPGWGQRYVWPALCLAGPVVLAIFLMFPALDQPSLHNPAWHLLIAGGTALLGVVLALLVLHVARRAQDARVFLVGMGFLSTASIFVTHAISTPDVLMSGRGLATALSAPLSLALGGVFFAISAHDITPSLNRWAMRRARVWLVVYLVFWLAYNWAFLIALPAATPGQAQAQPQAAATADAKGSEEQLPQSGMSDQNQHGSGSVQNTAPAPGPLDRLRGYIALAGLACYALAVGRYIFHYRRAPSPSGLAITYGIAFFGAALLTQYFSKLYALSFWLYHAQELMGFGVISYGVLGAYRRGLTDESLLESLFLSGTRARMQASYTHAMEALVAALSRGEQPTPVLRDTLRQRFGLAESQMQALEGAALAVAQERRQRRELEQLNQALRQSEDHRRQLTQMIVHDLKNPLTALVGFLEILRLDSLSESQSGLLESALRSGRNLAGLIGDLLDVGQFEEGRVNLERVPIPPRDLLTECAEEMRGWLIQERKTIAVETAGGLPPLCADQRLMRRVMLNLLSNAIKHTPEGTHIILRAAPYIALPASFDGDYQLAARQIVIEVEDDGPGIPAERLDRIFDRFRRFGGEANTRQDSTGLGLTLCRLAVEAHGGTIGVSSVVGQGTLFRMMLPAA